MSAFTRAENCPRQPLNARALIANLATLAAQRLLRIDSCASGRSPLRGPAETVAPGAWLTGQPAGLTHLNISAALSALSGTADISAQDVVLAAPPAGDGRSYGSFLDHALLNGPTVVATRPDELAAAASERLGTAAIVPLGLDGRATGPLRLFAVPS
jgi:hypothetical protein